MLGRITQSLPDTARLSEFRIDPDGEVVLIGTVIDESLVFELVNHFRRLPDVSQVALKGTAPDATVHGTRFTISLTTLRTMSEQEAREQDE